jgi:HAMP domain-containing protein
MKIRSRLLLSLLPSLAAIALLLGFSLMDPNLAAHLHLILTGTALLILITAAALYILAGTISQPIGKLKNSALAIAAGQYGESIQVQGPKELSELANTLNTMSECLLEHINRLKDTTLVTEKAALEAECARLLQQLMLQKNIEECPSDAIALKAISFPSALPRGLLLDAPKSEHPEHLQLHLIEAKEQGFEGIYQLLTHSKTLKEHPRKTPPCFSLTLALHRGTSLISAKARGCPLPYLWSLSNETLLELREPQIVQAGDFVLLMNRGMCSLFKEPSRIRELLTKVLKHFADEGLEVCSAMLRKELAFATKRKELEEDLHLICLHILKPEL